MKQLYLMRNEIGRWKIGISADPKQRLKSLQYSGGCEIEIVSTWIVEHASTPRGTITRQI